MPNQTKIRKVKIWNGVRTETYKNGYLKKKVDVRRKPGGTKTVDITRY